MIQSTNVELKINRCIKENFKNSLNLKQGTKGGTESRLTKGT